MAKVLINESNLQNIADAIRNKNGTTTKYKPAEMAAAIDAISTGDEIQHEDIPDYVKGEALRVANLVKSKQDAIRSAGGTPFTFLAMSDCHQLTSNANINTGNLHAGMGAKVLAYACDLDLCVFLGDCVWGASTSTRAECFEQLKTVQSYIGEALKAFHSSEQQETMTATGFQQIREQTELLRRQNYIRISASIMQTTELRWEALLADTAIMTSLTKRLGSSCSTMRRLMMFPCIRTSLTIHSLHGSIRYCRILAKNWLAVHGHVAPSGRFRWHYYHFQHH